MSYIKLTAVQKKIYRFIKQKLNSLERVEAVRKSAKGSPHRSTLPNVCRAGPWDERMWRTLFRYLGVSTVGKIPHTSNPLLKNFWNALSPVKDERKLKILWFRSKKNSTALEFSRGINTPSWSELDGKTAEETQTKETQIKETQTKETQKAPTTASRDTMKGDFSDQAFYILDYPPKKLGEGLKKAEPKKESQECASPPTKCRLCCPLPPQEFLPPERTLYIPNFQSPNVRYAILQSALTPDDKSGVKPGGGSSEIKTTENISENPQPTVEPNKDNPLEKPPTAQASTSETEQQALQESSQVPENQKPTEQKKETSVPLVDSLDFPEFMPDNTRKRKNLLSLANAKTPTSVETPDIPQMNALLFDRNEMKLQFTAVEAPTRIHKDEILVKISYAGVTKIDLLMIDGVIPCEQDSIIPGREVSGTVYAVGSDVDHVEPEDKIVINAYSSCSACRNCLKGLYASCLNGDNSLGVGKNGGWAEFVVVKKTEVHKVPEELGLDQAVLVMPLSCILSAQKKLNLSYDSNVIIQGLGLSGMLWASLLHSRGFKNVLVSDKNDQKRPQFDSLNLPYSFLRPEDVRKETADVVVECTGSSSSIERSLDILNPNGQICLFGKLNPASEIHFSPFDIAQKEITIVGNEGNNLCFSEAIDLAAILSSTYLNLKKLGVQKFDMSDFQRAFVMEKYGQVSKVVFTPET